MNHLVFDFFENLLEKDIYENLKKEFISKYIEEEGNPLEIDLNEGIIIVDPETSYNFDNYFKRNLNKHYLESKRNIDIGVLEITAKNIEPTNYLNTQLQILHSLEIKAIKYYPNRPIVYKTITSLKSFINEKYNPKSVEDVRIFEGKKTNYSSFDWDIIDVEYPINEISSIFDFLTSKNIISGSKEDFISGFTGEPVNDGINWLIKSSDKRHTSKPSLFAFIDYLMSQNFIKNLNGKEYNDAIKNVFRDFKGDTFKNIRDSKSKSTAEIDITIKNFIDSLYSPTP